MVMNEVVVADLRTCGRRHAGLRAALSNRTRSWQGPMHHAAMPMTVCAHSPLTLCVVLINGRLELHHLELGGDGGLSQQLLHRGLGLQLSKLSLQLANQLLQLQVAREHAQVRLQGGRSMCVVSQYAEPAMGYG
jgi:hypothetical protein